ncbi:hypothetical protein Bca52824_073453 [Brassica carinata]|uniref:Uncharacterized protein n=1 Tax=Brassica carinata TaxID=52824 RepID=A0A8X7QA09_BRACI|nr:hypothetical protein Bca52824_073453 [Brassica carinata]
MSSIGDESTTVGGELIHKAVESMQKELTEHSAYAYDIIGWNQKLRVRQQLEKEFDLSIVGAPHATSIGVSLPTAQIPAEPPMFKTTHRDEWEVSYIDTRINGVYCPLNNKRGLAKH